MGAGRTTWRDPLGFQHRRRPRPPLSLCTTAWDALRHGRPEAKDVTQRSDNGAERRRGLCPERAGRRLDGVGRRGFRWLKAHSTGTRFDSRSLSQFTRRNPANAKIG